VRPDIETIKGWREEYNSKPGVRDDITARYIRHTGQLLDYIAVLEEATDKRGCPPNTFCETHNNTFDGCEEMTITCARCWLCHLQKKD
jgi:hypothetical protein